MAEGGDEGPEKEDEREEERDEPGEVVLGGDGRKDRSRLQMRHSLTVKALREMGTQLAVCQQRLTSAETRRTLVALCETKPVLRHVWLFLMNAKLLECSKDEILLR